MSTMYPKIAYYQDDELKNERFEIDVQSNVHMRKWDMKGQVLSKRKDVVYQKIHVVPPKTKCSSVKPAMGKKPTVEDKAINMSRADLVSDGTQMSYETIAFPLKSLPLPQMKSLDSLTDGSTQPFGPTIPNRQVSHNNARMSLCASSPNNKFKCMNIINNPGLSVMAESRRKTKLKQVYPSYHRNNDTLTFTRAIKNNLMDHHDDSSKAFVDYDYVPLSNVNNSNIKKDTHKISKIPKMIKEDRRDFNLKNLKEKSFVVGNDEAMRRERLARKELDGLLEDNEVARILKSSESFGSFFAECLTSATGKVKGVKVEANVSDVEVESIPSTIVLDGKRGSKHPDLKDLLNRTFDQFCATISPGIDMSPKSS